MNEEFKENIPGNLEIAVIGMACRFPGAGDVHEFWDNLKNGRESISFFSQEELIEIGIEPGLLGNSHYVKARSVLADAGCFDVIFFDYTPKEAELMDPQVRIFHECIWEALEDAGYDPGTYKKLIGCYAGASNVPYWEALGVLSGKAETMGEFEAEQFTNKDYLSTRIAFRFNFRGPALTVQTACSTSLVAVHLACQGLLGGECDMAAAGGITVIPPTKSGYLYQESLVRSSDGHCRAFDVRANGTVFGDGAGVVVLKRLQDAITDRDHIYAVIKGSAINNDGMEKAGYTAPGIKGQASVIRSALEMAEVEPESIGYVETHGTGTSLGDPIEIEGLKLAFNTTKKGFCRIGSVKTNIGHLDTAAGIAGFIKTVLVLRHRLIPPSLHFKNPNPKIDFENSPFYVNTQLREWESNGFPCRAGVSSFGIGGTNAHVILEEAFGGTREFAPLPDAQHSKDYQLILLSAKTENALDRMTENLVGYLKKNRDGNLADTAYTLQAGRKAFKYRRMVTVSDMEELIEVLSIPHHEKVRTSLTKDSEPPVIFMFPGQGSQYVNMGRDIYRTEPVFREEMDQCFEILKPLMGYDIKEILYPFPGSNRSYTSYKSYKSHIDQTEVAQPLLFVIEYSLAKLLMKWGIKPYAMIGHSIGEYTAACLSGVFSLEDALHIVFWRGKLMQRVPGGAMVSVPLTEEELIPLLKGKENISLAAVNSPQHCVVSGTYQAVEAFENHLQKKEIKRRRLHTSHAFHSKMMESVMEEFRQRVAQIRLNKPQIPYISNLTGKWIAVGEAVDPQYWVKHLRATVRFADGIQQLLKQKRVIFLETGPGKALSSFARQYKARQPGHFFINLVRHPRENAPDDCYLLDKVGAMWLYGKTIDWSTYHSGKKRYRISLPTYSFEMQDFPLSYYGDLREMLSGVNPLSSTPSLEKRANISTWFYTPSWKRSVPGTSHDEKTNGVTRLIFLDSLGLCDQLAKGLSIPGHDMIIVRAGTRFEKVNRDVYMIQPNREEDYQRLMKDLHKQGRIPRQIIHLWNLTNANESSSGMEPGSKEPEKVLEKLDESIDRSFYSLLYLAKGVGKYFASESLTLQVVTNNMQEVTGGDLVFPEKAAVLGPIMIIPAEYPRIICQAIDVVLPGPGNWKEKRLLEQLLTEFTAEPARENPLVAFRESHRLVKNYEPVPLEKNTAQVPRLKAGGVYLVTGGLGGIGSVLAQHLAVIVKNVKLILTGRSFFPPPEERDQWLSTHGPRDFVSKKIKQVQQLEAAGARVLVFAADVSDYQQMQRMVNAAEKQWGPINGVIHCAGVPGGGVIQGKTRERADHVLLPKIKGTMVLDLLFKDYSLDFFILCSSVNSIIPVLGQVDYFSANAFLDAFAYYKNSAGKFVVSINWDTWQEAGMAVEAANRFNGLDPVKVSDSHPHPLIDGCILHESEQEVYETIFSLKRFWVLDEHKAGGKGVVPGTTYLEMVQAVFAPPGGNYPIEIREVYFLHPLMVGEGEEREVQLLLKKHEETVDFLIKSRRKGEESRWQEHAKGEIRKGEPHRAVFNDIKKIEQRCTREKPVKSLNTNRDQQGLVVFGPRWNSLKQLKYTEEEALAVLDLSGTYAADFESYQLHPALLDAATGFWPSYSGAKKSYIPFSYRKITVNSNLTPQVFSLCRFLNDHESRGDFYKFNITIMDENGLVLVDIEEFTMLTVSQDIRARIEQSDSLPAFTSNPVLHVHDDHEPGTQYEGKNKDNPTPMPMNFLEKGIRAGEGAEVFDRILAGALPQVVVSTVDLLERFRAMNRSVVKPSGEELYGLKFSGIVTPRPELPTQFTAPVTPTQKQIAEIWQEQLGIESVGINDDFFELGGDSLKAITIGGKIHKKMDAEIPLSEFFNHPTIRELSQYIVGARKSKFYSLQPGEKKEYYPLSSAQKRLYVLQEMNRSSTSYNLPMVVTLEKDVDKQRLENTFKKLLERHDSLCTSFEIINNEPVMRVHDRCRFQVEYFDSAREEEKQAGPFLQPFDLAHAPLLRVRVIKNNPGSSSLMLDKHHIICDGTSHMILEKDFTALVTGEELPPLKLQFKDFSEWQNSNEQKLFRKKQETYWLDTFKHDPPVLNLPYDYPRPELQSFEGNRLKLILREDETRALRTLALKQGATLYILLLAALNILLAKLSGNEDIVIGTPVLGRRHADLQLIFGMFANTLALRNFPLGEKNIGDFAGEVKKRTLETFENQDYLFEDLVKQLNRTYDPSRNPIFDVGFSLHDVGAYNYESKISRFDLLFEGSEKDGNVSFQVEYCTKLFKQETVERFINCFKKIISRLTSDWEKRIGNIEIISPGEKKQILTVFNNTSADYPGEKTIHELFEEQMKQTPDYTALVGQIPNPKHSEGTGGLAPLYISYRELNKKSDQLAYLLIEKGVKPDSIVGIMMERSIEMIITILGILKAGGAYLPIDLDYPPGRIRYMLADSKVIILVTKSDNISGFIVGDDIDIISIDEVTDKNRPKGAFIHPSTLLPFYPSSPSNLAYIIYTSGSTGDPKGVIVEHRGVVNYISWAVKRYIKNERVDFPLFTPISFDLTVTSIFVPLFSGNAVLIYPAEYGENTVEKIIDDNRAGVMKLTPTHLQLIRDKKIDNPHSTIKRLILGGEQLTAQLAADIYANFNHKVEIYNEYGPTEAVVGCMIYQFNPGKDNTGSVPIGTPADNTQIYILDEGLNLVPFGAAGELCVSGDGVARGYVNNPELTAGRFVDNVFKDGERMYKTGDLARWLPGVNTQIEFLGRKDRQVKIKGFRIETGEIEAVLNHYPGIRETLVTAVTHEGLPDMQRLVAYIIMEKNNEGHIPVNKLRDFSKRKLPDYMIPSVFVKLEQFPLLPGGKIDRRRLPSPAVEPRDTKKSFISPRTPLEENLVKIWEDVLKVNRISAADDFFELGGDSILSLQVAARAQQAGINITSAQVFRYPRIDRLAAVAEEAAGPDGERETQACQEMVLGPVPLTPIQHWFFNLDLPDVHHYNQAVMVEMNPKLSRDHLVKAFRQLLIHHDALRMHFKRKPYSWRQVNTPIEEDIPFWWTDLSEIPRDRQKGSIQEAAAQLQASFDLEKAPLMRAAVFYSGDKKPAHLLLIFHHLVIDGVSWRILLNDLEFICRRLSNGEPVHLPPKTTSYKEWAEFLVTYAQSDFVKQTLPYWLSSLSVKIPPLPVDFCAHEPKKNNTTPGSSFISVQLDKTGTKALLSEIHHTFHTRINDLLLTALVQVFASWTGERFLLVDLESHGREEISQTLHLERTVGWFTVIFPVILDIRGLHNPVARLKSVKERLRQILGGGMTFGLLRYLYRDDRIKRKLEALPQPQVLFNYLGQVDQVLSEASFFKPSDLPTGPDRSFRGERRYLLEINAIIVEERLQVDWMYNKNFYQPVTIEKLANAFIEALGHLIAICKSSKMEFTPSDFPLVQLDEKKLAQLTGNNPNIEDIYPLAPLQQQMISYNIFTSGTGLNTQQLSWELEGDLDIPAFREAWQMVIKRHSLLRTVFKWKRLKNPLQVVHQWVEIPFRYLDCRSMTAEEQKQAIDTYVREDRQKGFKLAAVPLIRLCLISLHERLYRFIWSYSTSLFDNWSWALILEELFYYYDGYVKKRPVIRKESPPFADYIRWLVRQPESEAKQFWKSEFEGFLSPVDLKLTRFQGKYISKNFKAAERHIRLLPRETHQLNALAKKFKLTLGTILQGTWVIMLSHFSGEEDILSAVLSYGRSPEIDGIQSMVGLFINILPIRFKVENNCNLLDWLRQLQEKHVGLRQYEYVSVEDISSWTGVPLAKIQKAIYERTFVMVKSPGAEFIPGLYQTDTLKISDFSNSLRLNVPLRVYVESLETIVIKIKYDAAYFHPRSITEVAGCWERLLNDMVENPKLSVGELKSLKNP
jgi:amino acid adenylation domain-containing protein/non-ribosomal peptide synthase protein (TIGR01720 family)